MRTLRNLRIEFQLASLFNLRSPPPTLIVEGLIRNELLLHNIIGTRRRLSTVMVWLVVFLLLLTPR